ncbi:MAG: hypothetical protein AAGE92_16965, partial [Cyanobacteria bacterium P01_G01_bin.4]
LEESEIDDSGTTCSDELLEDSGSDVGVSSLEVLQAEINSAAAKLNPTDFVPARQMVRAAEDADFIAAFVRRNGM